MARPRIARHRCYTSVMARSRIAPASLLHFCYGTTKNCPGIVADDIKVLRLHALCLQNPIESTTERFYIILSKVHRPDGAARRGNISKTLRPAHPFRDSFLNSIKCHARHCHRFQISPHHGHEKYPPLLWTVSLFQIYIYGIAKHTDRQRSFPKSYVFAESIKKLSTLSTVKILQFPSFPNISPHYIHVIHTLLFLYHPYILQLLPSFFLYDPLNDGQAPIYPQSYPHYPQSPVCSLTHTIYPSCPQFYPQKQKQRASPII